jgi:hypothetical protein
MPPSRRQHRREAKGLWALGGPWAALGLWAGMKSAHEARDESMSKPAIGRVYASQRLSLFTPGKAHRGQPRSEPDRGKPAVRDRSGGQGQVLPLAS